jgi:hypothetical protein
MIQTKQMRGYACPQADRARLSQLVNSAMGNPRVAFSRAMLYCMRNQEVAYEHE